MPPLDAAKLQSFQGFNRQAFANPASRADCSADSSIAFAFFADAPAFTTSATLLKARPGTAVARDSPAAGEILVDCIPSGIQYSRAECDEAERRWSETGCHGEYVEDQMSPALDPSPYCLELAGHEVDNYPGAPTPFLQLVGEILQDLNVS